MPVPQRLIFGPFLLDCQDERLWRQAEAIRIGSKALGVLRCLTAAAGQLVTKEQLLETVWPEAMVGEAVIAVAIRELRRALGDTARAPQFIETVHRRGYRFIAPVTAAEATTDMSNAIESAPIEPLVDADASEFFVGREAELARMREWLATALQGQRQVGFVAGDPGIGKTALVDAFVAAAQSDRSTESVWVGHGQCVDHYGIGDAYLPILEALGRLCHSSEGDAFRAILRQYAPSWLAQMPSLLSPADWTHLERFTQHVTQSSMIRELAEALEALAAMRPLVLVLEDLHWSDPSTLALLMYVARRRDPARLLILGVYRPVDIILQGHPLSRVLSELRQHRQCVELELGAFTEAAVTTYLAQRFDAPLIPEMLSGLLHQRCSGNPLFLIALVDDLVRQGILQTKAKMLHLAGGAAAVSRMAPESVQQLIAQHVGQLSLEEQTLLEAASVAGMTFSVAALAAGVAMQSAAIETQLTAWARQGRFVQAQGAESWPDGVVSARYEFRHALYHEVILQRISPGQYMHLHQAIGARKERAYAGQTAVIAAALASHFEAAQDFQRAVIYRQQAAESALQRSAYEEAIAHLTQGLELLAALPKASERDQLELTLHLALGAPLSVTKGYAAPEVERSYTRARELHQQLSATLQLPPEMQRQFQFCLVRGVQFYLVRGNLHTAREVGETCLQLAGADPTFRLAAHYALALSLFYLGDFALALSHAEQCAALYDPQRHHALASLYGYDLGVASRGYAAQALWILGYPEQAQQRIQGALALAQDLAHPFSEAFILGHRAVLHQLAADGRAVYEQAQALTALCAEKGFHQWVEMAAILQGWGLAMQGQSEVGIAQMRQGLTRSGASGAGLGQAPVMTQLAEACCLAGRSQEGLRALEQAFSAMEATGEHWWAAEAYRLRGELLLQAGVDLSKPGLTPQSSFQQALDTARSQQAKFLELRAAVSLARLWRCQNKSQDARTLLAPVYEWFSEGLNTMDLQAAASLFAQLKA